MCIKRIIVFFKVQSSSTFQALNAMLNSKGTERTDSPGLGPLGGNPGRSLGRCSRTRGG